MHAIAKLAILGATLGGLTVAGAGTALADVPRADVPRWVTISTDGPFDDFDGLDDVVKAPWHGHIVGLDDDCDDDGWGDDEWDDWGDD